MNWLRVAINFLTDERLKSWLFPLWNVLVWIWKALWYPAALPVVVILALAFLGLRSCQQYNEVVREAVAYQDSIIRAQGTELWQLRADTLEANFEIRQLYTKLDAIEKQEVIYFEHLRRANDSALQAELDSVYNRHVRGNYNQPGGQSAGGFTPILSGGSLAAPKFNPNTGWGTTDTTRPLSR